MSTDSDKQLLEIGEARMIVVENLLVKGTPCLKLADMMQQEWKVCLDVDRMTLQKRLRRYYLRHIAPKVAITLDSVMKKAGGMTTIRKISAHLNVLEDVYQLIETQKARVNRLLTTEAESFEDPEKSSFSLKERQDLREEIRTLMEMYRVTGAFQLKTGILSRKSNTVSGIFEPDPANPNKQGFDMSEQHRADFALKAKRLARIIEGDFTEIDSALSAELESLTSATPLESNPGN